MVDSPPRRVTIGVILDNLAGESRSSLWPGIADTIQARDGNLLCFTGGFLHDSYDFTRRGNVVYEMIDPHALDGLIIWTSSLASYVEPASIRRFCERYRPLPMVSIGSILENIPSIVLDSYQGMRDALIHLITVHQRRRIVFIRGPEGHRDAEERYRAYVEVLDEFGLPFVPELVSPQFKWFDPGGTLMMNELLGAARHAQQLPFDAVVGVNDNVAVEAMDVLQARGIRVPEEVSVVGFNDAPLSRLTTPLLTTVPWRMYERGREAARLILARLAHEAVPARVLLPTQLIVRQSCGCQDPSILLAQGEWSPAGGTAEPFDRETCLAALEQTIEEKERPPQALVEFCDSFLDELHGKTPAVFLPTLETILHQVVVIGGNLSAWQLAVSTLRRQILPSLLADQPTLQRAEDLWHQARVMISERARRMRAYKEWQAQQQTLHLRRIYQALTTKTSVPALMTALAQELPPLGISSCAIALYEDAAQPWVRANPTMECRVALAFDEGRIDLTADTASRNTTKEASSGFRRDAVSPDPSSFTPFMTGSARRGEVDTDERRISARAFAMGSDLPGDTPLHLLVMPLHFQDEQWGLIRFRQQPIGDIYEVLRDEISNALKNIQLAEQNARLYQQALHAERQAQIGRQLAEQADQLKSSFLSMVSHELLTPLVLLVGLSEMMLRKSTGEQFALPESFRADLTRMHQSSQQLGNLVRDVLDLARSQIGQLKLAKKPLDLHETLQGVILVGEEMARAKGLAWRVELPEQLSGVYGDAARLHQVTLNLIANAVKFTTQGSVTLAVEADADTITIKVSDTGLGVPAEEQDAIFDEFRQSERTIARGFGGLGIGLALCRQLVEMHGGQIGVYSAGEENAGSTFYFTLPVLNGAENGSELFDATPETEADAQMSLNYLAKPMDPTTLAHALQRYGLDVEPDLAPDIAATCRILIVDDDPAILALHAQIVREALPNSRVLQASDGRQALEMMTRETPSLVLLDLMMPELDGIGVLAAMHENGNLQRVPVIILTAQTLSQDQVTQLHQRVAAVLQKGLFTSDETLAHIKQTLAGDKRLGSDARRMVAQVVAFIHEHYAEPISREEMASQLGVSARHLTRCFHQAMGISPITYLNRYRVKRAKQLLDASDKNISEIAEAVGFSSSNYFTDAFRREMGMSPRDYRRGR